jgi:hypothetical protein
VPDASTGKYPLYLWERAGVRATYQCPLYLWERAGVRATYQYPLYLWERAGVRATYQPIRRPRQHPWPKAR